MTVNRCTETAKAFEPSINHWKVNGYKERMTKAQYQWLLLNRDLEFRFGAGCEWKGKHVDAGIYEVWLEERP